MAIKRVWLTAAILVGGTVITVALWRLNDTPRQVPPSPKEIVVADSNDEELSMVVPVGMRPIIETKTRLVKYSIMKPVYEKHQKEVNYTVMKPVYETKEKVVKYTVCTMVPETKTKTVEYTTCRMVSESKEKTVEYQEVRYVPVDDSKIESK